MFGLKLLNAFDDHFILNASETKVIDLNEKTIFDKAPFHKV